jgi:hypothetical protein
MVEGWPARKSDQVDVAKENPIAKGSEQCPPVSFSATVSDASTLVKRQ